MFCNGVLFGNYQYSYLGHRSFFIFIWHTNSIFYPITVLFPVLWYINGKLFSKLFKKVQ